LEEGKRTGVAGDQGDGLAAQAGLEVAVSDPVAELPRPGFVLPPCGEKLAALLRAGGAEVVHLVYLALRCAADAAGLQVAGNGGMTAQFLNGFYPVSGDTGCLFSEASFPAVVLDRYLRRYRHDRADLLEYFGKGSGMPVCQPEVDDVAAL